MLRDILREAWERDRVAVLLSVPVAVLAVLSIYILLVVAIIGWQP